ncbi:type II CAAX endopeptidase family protein [Nonomuraea sp. NPDC052116]|uniref:CPBP family intramembrane glutamic endopeptidase n=1 Tax=Nonomuraea sp. NPDC052116 TaxID=3155665 RepID=UPI00344992A4
MVLMLAQATIGSTLPLLFIDRTSPLVNLLGPLGITLTALLFVYLIRRFLDRRPWSSLGWGKPWHLLLGVFAGALPMLAACGMTMAVGAGTWVSMDASVLLGSLPLGAVMLLLNQAFPEELLWRGHVFDSLSQRLSPRAVLIITSAAFGSMHIFSQGSGTTIGEKLLYVLMATALGFAAGAARVRGGGLWMAAGVHLGFHMGMRSVPMKPESLSVLLVLMAIGLALAGVVLLRGQGVLKPSPRASEQVGA